MTRIRIRQQNELIQIITCASRTPGRGWDPKPEEGRAVGSSAGREAGVKRKKRVQQEAAHYLSINNATWHAVHMCAALGMSVAAEITCISLQTSELVALIALLELDAFGCYMVWMLQL